MVNKRREITAGKPEKKMIRAQQMSHPSSENSLDMRPAPQPTHRYPSDLGLLNFARLHTEKS
jgi:hypothetical protein